MKTRKRRPSCSAGLVSLLVSHEFREEIRDKLDQAKAEKDFSPKQLSLFPDFSSSITKNAASGRIPEGSPSEHCKTFIHDE